MATVKPSVNQNPHFEKQKTKLYDGYNPVYFLLKKFKHYFTNICRGHIEVYTTPLPHPEPCHSPQHQQQYVCSNSASELLAAHFTARANTNSEIHNQQLNTIAWREGLLHSLGMLHGSSKCRLSLGDLIELHDKAPYLPLQWPLRASQVSSSNLHSKIQLKPSSDSTTLSNMSHRHNVIRYFYAH